GTTGGKIDDNPAECEAQVPDKDRFDDGVVFGGNFVPGGAPVPVTITVQTATDIEGGGHLYNQANPMFANAWFDWNADGVWENNATEYPINGQRLESRGPHVLTFMIAAPNGAQRGGFARFRLDYRENVGQALRFDPTLQLDKGAAQFGEVE